MDTFENFKIRFREPVYYVNKKKRIVACSLCGSYERNTYPFEQNENVIGIARCHPNDNFDVELGKKIAHAKAENMLYNIVANEYKCDIEKLDRLRGSLSRFLDKSKYCVQHNKEYIKRITDF